MYHSTPRLTVPHASDKAIRFGLCVLRYQSVSDCLKRVQFGRPMAAYASRSAAQKHAQVHRDTCDASLPPVLVAKEPAVCAASVHGSQQAAVRNRTPLGRCKTSREGGKHDARLPERKGGRVLWRISSLAYP